MGVRIFTDAHRLGFKPSGVTSGHLLAAPGIQRVGGQGLLGQQISGNMKMMAIYDGTSGKQGLPDALAANVAWMDPSGLYRSGNNFGPTFFNAGATICVIDACSAPRDYAYNPTTARVAELTAWKTLATLDPGEDAYCEMHIYSLVRFTFTQSGSNPGCVVALTD